MSALAMLEPPPVDEFDDEPRTSPDLLAALPMRALVFPRWVRVGAAENEPKCTESSARMCASAPAEVR